MKKHVLAACLVVGLGSAQAQFYGEVGAGLTQTGIRCPGQSRCDDSGTGLRGLGGYRWSSGLAMEIGWLLVTNMKHGHEPAYGSELSAYTYGLGWHAELGEKLSLVLRGGLASVKGETDFIVLGLPGKTSRSETRPYVGASLGYRLNSVISLRAGLEISRASLEYSNGQRESFPTRSLLFSVGFNY